MNIYEKLQESRIRLQDLNLKKSGKNKFSGFNYYELSDFMPKVNTIFGELKLHGAFSIDSDGLATLKIVNVENPDEFETFSSPTVSVELKGCSAIQGIGAVHTYMRRYLYVNALEIVESDELDAQAGKIETCGQAEKQPTIYLSDIEKVKTIDDLNRVYNCLAKNCSTSKDAWKNRLKNKADCMKASFNKQVMAFERAAA
jgi:hypothetical protein